MKTEKVIELRFCYHRVAHSFARAFSLLNERSEELDTTVTLFTNCPCLANTFGVDIHHAFQRRVPAFHGFFAAFDCLINNLCITVRT